METPEILIVDDMGSVRAMVVNTLKIKGLKASEANSPGDALCFLEQEPSRFGLIISDLNMPKTDGLEFLKQVKTHDNPQIAQIPFFLLTTEANPQKIKEAKRLGLDSWIQKPYSVENLLAQIRYHVCIQGTA